MDKSHRFLTGFRGGGGALGFEFSMCAITVDLIAGLTDENIFDNSFWTDIPRRAGFIFVFNSISVTGLNNSADRVYFSCKLLFEYISVLPGKNRDV